MLASDEAGLNLADVAEAARRRLDPVHWDFFAGGAGEERTLRANEAAFGRRWLVPRVLRGVGERDLRVSLFGSRLSMPVLIAPTAFHRLAHPDGEVGHRAGRRRRAGTVMVVSMAATRPVEEIAAAGGPLWFQLYPAAGPGVHRHRGTAGGGRRVPGPGRHRRLARVRSARARPAARLRRPAARLVCENMRDATGRVRDIEMDARA